MPTPAAQALSAPHPLKTRHAAPQNASDRAENFDQALEEARQRDSAPVKESKASSPKKAKSSRRAAEANDQTLPPDASESADTASSAPTDEREEVPIATVQETDVPAEAE